ncbi:MAG: DUF5690 family protein [Bacteroidota bacterium]
MVAAFGAYFCMYAFRKPFNAGVYAGLTLWGLHYKSILVITQVLGYMLSKFIGIKIISELKPASRNKLIVALILIAETALLLFGLVPYPYNFVCLFLNGLPLGMVWGVVFSYLEGRRFTEVLAMGLSTSLIISSGYLKTIYFYVHEWLTSLSEFWLPFVIGLLFLPLFLLFVWMLSVIPAPSPEDIQRRSPRLPMTNEDKRNVFRQYGIGVVGLVIVYAMLATLRDFRDNFSVEIWNEIEPGWNKTVFAKTETIAGIVVLIAVGLLSIIKSNRKGFIAVNFLIIGGLSITAVSTLLFHTHAIAPFWWMLLSGTGLFLAYIPFQVAMFERMIAFFRIKANAGFFVYICDAIGYLGSVILLLYKEFFMHDLSWSNMLIRFSYMQVIVSVIIMVLCIGFFLNRKKGPHSIQKVPTLN